MPNTAVTDLLSRFETIKNERAARNAECDELYKRYTGEWHQEEFESTTGGLRIVLSHLSTWVEKHIGLATLCPDIQIPLPEENDRGRERADKIEKALYAIWEANYMDEQQLDMAFYLSLMGLVYLKVSPTGSDKKLCLSVCDPREVYAETSAINWRRMRRVFQEHDIKGDELQELYDISSGYDADAVYTLVEYWDTEDYVLVCKEKEAEIRKAKHGLGMVPYSFAQNIPCPRRHHGLSDVEQSVGLIDYINDFYSYMAEIAEYCANPTTVITGARYGTEDVPRGPGGAIHLDVGGSARFLQWEGTPPSLDRQLGNAMEALRDQVGTAEPLFGRVAGAAKSGAALSRLMTAAVLPRTQIKQIKGGRALRDANEILLRMIERFWGKAGMELRGRRKQQDFGVEIKASDVNGYYRNYIVYPPSIFDYPTRQQMELQLVGAGLTSKYTARENLGIRSPEDERKRIIEEMKEEIELREELSRQALKGESSFGEIMQTRSQTPGEVMRVAKQIEKGGLPGRMGRLRERGQTSESRGSSEGGEKRGGEGRIYLSDISPAFARLSGLRGHAYLIGGIVTEGYTDRDLDILVTVRSDVPKIRRVIAEALGEEIAARVHFSGTKATPTSPHIALTGTVEGGGLRRAAVRPFP